MVKRLRFDVRGVGVETACVSLDADHVSESPFMSDAVMPNIASQNPELPPPPAGARFVIAGQQPGILTGPLYTFLKAVTAISLAERLSHESERPVLPLFWTASEDHDVLEVNRVTVGGKRFVHPYPGDIARGKMPQVGDISIEEAREPLLAFLRETLPQTGFTSWVLDMAASCDYSGYAAAFAALMRSIFAEWELRIVDPMAIRPLTAPVLAALVERWQDVETAFSRGTEIMKKDGLDPPLRIPGIYEIADNCRVPVEIAGGTARLSSGETDLSGAAEEIRRRVMDFSPNAALRPVLQDAVLPVTVTVAGPSEIAYLRQIQPIYETAGVVPSLPFPRVSATFVEDKIRRAAEKAGIAIESILEDGAGFEDRVPDVDDPGIAEVKESGRALIEKIDKAGGKNPSRPLARNRKGLEAQIDRIIRRLEQERLETSGIGRNHIRKISEALFPGGKPQERAANVMQFLNLYGPEFVRRSVEDLDPFKMQHQIVIMSVSEGE